MKHREYFESYSCLAYNVVGLLSLLIHEDILFCMSLQALGIGAFVYHYDKTANRELNVIWKFDWWAMAFVHTVIAGMYFDSELAWVLLIVYHCVYGYVLMGKMSVYIEVFISAIPGIFAIFLNRSLLNFAVVFAVFGLSVLVRSKDKDPRQVLEHDSIYHGTWHFMTAAFYYLAVYLNI